MPFPLCLSFVLQPSSAPPRSGSLWVAEFLPGKCYRERCWRVSLVEARCDEEFHCVTLLVAFDRSCRLYDCASSARRCAAFSCSACKHFVLDSSPNALVQSSCRQAKSCLASMRASIVWPTSSIAAGTAIANCTCPTVGGKFSLSCATGVAPTSPRSTVSVCRARSVPLVPDLAASKLVRACQCLFRSLSVCSVRVLIRGRLLLLLLPFPFPFPRNG